MVDTPAAAAAIKPSDGWIGRARPEVLTGAAGLQLYETLSADAVHGPAQSGAWVGSWVRNCAPDFFVAALVQGSQPLLALALEVTSYGPFRVARFCGGQHANGNFPATRRDYLASASVEDMRALGAEISKGRPDVDLVLLERQVTTLGTSANPLRHLPKERSPNIALAADIRGGFDAILARMNGPRKRKKHRYRERKFQAAGGFRRLEARTAGDVQRMLDAFFAMKAERFRKMGVPDTFGSDRVRAFFLELFSSSLDERPSQFVLHGLEVDGVLRAVTGSTCCGDRIICDFAGFVDDGFAQYGPGEFLLYENIADACAQGFSIYDLGVGDEPYKRSWCEIETEHFDTVLPITAKGQLLAGWLRGFGRAKRLAKSNPAIWSAVKRLRMLAGGGARSEADPPS